MSNKPKFLADAMLGNIAKKLRLLGYDCKYYAIITDEQLLSIAKNENRILVTKDTEIANIGKKRNIATLDLMDTDEITQLTTILKHMDVHNCKIDMTDIRCAICNYVLQPIEKERILNRVPIGISQTVSQFWTCNCCNRVYWEGTHIRNLRKLVDEINERL